MAKIKVGVFGAQRGKVMIEVLASHPDAEIVAVCDRYVPALNAVKEIAEKYNVWKGKILQIAGGRTCRI